MARRAGLGAPARTMMSASALTTLGAIAPFLLGSQAVLIREELGFGTGLMGVAVSLFFASAASATVWGGRWITRLSPSRGRLLAGALVAGGGLCVAVLAHSWWVLAAGMIVLGLGNAACQGTSNKAVTHALPPHRRGLGFGIKQSAVPAAIMFGGLAVPTTTALLGWRSTFVVIGLVGVAVAAWAVLRSPSPGSVGSDGGVDEVDPARLDLAPRGPLLLCGLSITCASAAANFLGAYLPTWAHEVGLSVATAGLLVALGSSLSIVIRVAQGHRADRRFGGNVSLVIAEMLVGAVCLGVLALVPASWAVVVFGLLALSVGWSWPGLFLYAVARVGRDDPAAASSVVQAGAFAGGAIGPVSFGVMVSALGFRGAWALAAGAFLVAAVLAYLGRRGLRADLRERPPSRPLGYGGGRVEPRFTTGPGQQPGGAAAGSP